MKPSKQQGFTIVELLIVIVVIAILAAISIVAYNGIQQRARETTLANDAAAVKKAMQLYKIDEGTYPVCNGGGSECDYANDIKGKLESVTGMQGLPEYNFRYNRVGDAWAMHQGYWSDSNSWTSTGRGDQYQGVSRCKFGEGFASTWWGSAPTCG